MRNRAILAASLLTVMVTACGSTEQPAVVEQIIVREPGEAASTLAVAGDAPLDLVAIGRDAFQMCSGCHVIEAGAPSSAGPNLHGVVGRAAGSLEGYPFSDALAQSNITWDEASLDQYVADPAGYLPGTDMLAGAVRDEEARAAIIAYLASTSTGSSTSASSDTGE